VSLEELQRKAKQGNLEAMNQLALAYAKGDFGFIDLVQAVSLLEQAASGGLTTAAFNLGSFYLNGVRKVFQGELKELAADHQVASYWLEKASALEDADAQFTLAYMYDRSLCVDLEGEAALVKARQLYEEAAGNGSARAQYDLGCIYMFGRGLPINLKEALYWFKQAEASGVARASLMVAELEGK
jgi:TPR repeat protein